MGLKRSVKERFSVSLVSVNRQYQESVLGVSLGLPPEDVESVDQLVLVLLTQVSWHSLSPFWGPCNGASR